MLRAWSRWAPLTGLVSAVLGVAGAAIEIMTNPPGSDANTPLAGLGSDRSGGRGGDSNGRFSFLALVVWMPIVSILI